MGKKIPEEEEESDQEDWEEQVPPFSVQEQDIPTKTYFRKNEGIRMEEETKE